MRALLLTALLFTAGVHATQWAPVSVEELFKSADVVALVEVSEGHLLGSGEKNCGAIYTGHVERQFKGVSQQSIQFGHAPGYEIGERYVLFLTSPGKEFQKLSSTNSISMAGQAEFHKRCGAKLVAHRVMQSGLGALKATWSVRLEFQNGIAVMSKYVIFPESLKAVPADLGERHQLDAPVWLKEDQVIEYLSTLRQ